MAVLIWVQTMIGIFSFLSFLVIAAIQQRNQLPVAPWLFLCFTSVSLIIGELGRVFFHRDQTQQIIFTVAFICLLLVALTKFWESTAGQNFMKSSI